jgi:hypothetical protein
VPDYFIRLADGSAIVIDVRPDGRVTPPDQEVFQATEDLCATVDAAGEPSAEQEEDAPKLAKIIPLKIYDPHKEAETWW